MAGFQLSLQPDRCGAGQAGVPRLLADTRQETGGGFSPPSLPPLASWFVSVPEPGIDLS